MSTQSVVHLDGHDGCTVAAIVRGGKLLRVVFTNPELGISVEEIDLPCEPGELVAVEPGRPSIFAGGRLLGWNRPKSCWEEVVIDEALAKAREKRARRAAAEAETMKGRRHKTSPARPEPAVTVFP